eukprot:IDg5950t1
MASTHIFVLLLILSSSFVSARSIRPINPDRGHQHSSGCCREAEKISVSGVGNIEYKADIAVVRLGVTLSGRVAANVQNRLAWRSSGLVRYLRLHQVKKLQTTGVRLNPEYKYWSGKSHIVGYSGSNSVSFEVLASVAGKILDGAVTNGASNIENVSFKGTAAAVFTARRRALRQAAYRAQQEARTVVFALGKKLGGPISVQISTFYNAPATQAYSRNTIASAALSKPVANTAVVSGTRNNRATVSIDFKIY